MTGSDVRSYVTKLGASSITSEPHVHFGNVPRIAEKEFNKRASVLSVSNSAPSQLARVREIEIRTLRDQYTPLPANDTTLFPFEQNCTWLETRNVHLANSDAKGMWVRVKHPKHRALFTALVANALTCFMHVLDVFPKELAFVAAYAMPCETLYARARRQRGLLFPADIAKLRTCIEQIFSAGMAPHTTSLRDFMWSPHGVQVNPCVLHRAEPKQNAQQFLETTHWSDFALLTEAIQLHLSNA